VSAARVIIEMGAGVDLAPGGQVRLTGLKALAPETRQAVIDLARTRKADIIRELSRGDEAATGIQPDGRERRRMITPAMVDSYRAARQWLLLRLDALLAAGWTRDSLFRLKPPLGHLFNNCVAWSQWWTFPGMVPSIGPAGEIVFGFNGGAALRARPC